MQQQIDARQHRREFGAVVSERQKSDVIQTLGTALQRDALRPVTEHDQRHWSLMPNQMQRVDQQRLTLDGGEPSGDQHQGGARVVAQWPQQLCA